MDRLPFMWEPHSTKLVPGMIYHRMGLVEVRYVTQ